MNLHIDPSFAEVTSALSSFAGMASAPEIQGHFCGLACTLGRDAAPLWASSIVADADADSAPGPAVQAVLEEVASTTWSSLDEGDLSLKLLLPDDEQALNERAESLAHWCTGFLHGLGTGKNSSSALASGAAADVLTDFAQIARAGAAEDELDEEGEVAYAELVEFVRVSVQLVFEEFEPVRSLPTNALTH